MRRMTFRFVWLMLGSLAAFASMPADAQQYPPTSGNLTVDKTTVAPGGSVTVSGTQCAGGSTVSLTFDGTSAGSTTASSQGTFTSSVTIPAGTAPGDHTVTATCPNAAGGTRVLGAQVNVNQALPRTGADRVAPIAVSAAGLLLVGLVLVFGVRQRNRHARL